MAGVKFQINTSRLGADARQMEQMVNAMEKQISAMRISVGQLNNMWEGTSKQAFVQAFTDDSNTVEDVLKELQALYCYDMEAKNSYELCEQQILELVSNIKV